LNQLGFYLSFLVSQLSDHKLLVGCITLISQNWICESKPAQNQQNADTTAT
jgi:hypothetical protein